MGKLFILKFKRKAQSEKRKSDLVKFQIPSTKFQTNSKFQITNSNDRNLKRNTIEIQWKYNRNTVEIRRNTIGSEKTKKLL